MKKIPEEVTTKLCVYRQKYSKFLEVYDSKDPIDIEYLSFVRGFMVALEWILEEE